VNRHHQFGIIHEGATALRYNRGVMSIYGRLSVLAVLGLAATMAAQTSGEDARMEKRIDALVARMTLEEKLGQMSQSNEIREGGLTDRVKEEIRKGRWGSFLNAGTYADRVEAQRIAMKESRLGIPLIFGRDVIHGYRTIFPIPLGQSTSWDPDLVERAAHIAGRETAAMGIQWTFAPMLDIARDPRWGRIAESLGEDPYLASLLGAAMVRGFEGASLDAPGSIAACAKHYVGYGAAEGGRDYNTTWIPEVELRNVYLRTFEAAEKAGAATFMSAFNDLDGIPASANEFTLRQVLRHEWGFDGFVVSDWNSVIELINHGYATDPADAAFKALRGGVDMEMASTSYYDTLKSQVEAGKVDMKWIDDAVRNILRVKMRLGLFDKTMPSAPNEAELFTPEAREIAKKLATESAVLLKNDTGTLPLAKTIGHVAVIGPLADSPVDQMGCWVRDANASEVVTPLAALREMLGASRVLYTPGLKTSRDESHAGFADALAAARGADAVLLFLGEEQSLSGEARSRAFLNLPEAQEALVEDLAQAGKPMIAVIMAGRPLTFPKVAVRVSAVLYAWHPGTMGGPAIADLLFGNAVPSGKLTTSFPRTVGQVPIYYDHMNTGRPPTPQDLGISMGTPTEPPRDTSKYIDVDYTPAYPFGFGLSYATFEYSNIKLSSPTLPMNGALTVSADITNTGSVEADEIVELYTRQLVGSITRPVRELKGFRRLHLKPGEKQTVEFTLRAEDLAFYNDHKKLVTEPGSFQVWVAPDSARGLRADFRVVE
jgi:beta-glucosidase